MKNIILLGPKHCGKTSVAKALGDYIDLDEEITRITGKTPRQLYNEGVEVFQKAETDSLRLCVSARDKFLIATGGGIVDNPEAINIMKNLDAIKIFLNIFAETAWKRISCADELPPFLQTENPRETHRTLHEKRAEAYKQLADIIIEAENKTPQEIAKDIISKIEKHNLNIV